MNFTLTDEINGEDRDSIFNGLLEYNLSKIEDKNPKDLGIYVDENGKRIAGIIAETHGNWLTVSYLWVDGAYRKQHIGSELLNKAEKEAIKRGCKYAFLDTFGFQASDFYKKYGYKEVFILENYPISGSRHYYTKSL